MLWTDCTCFLNAYSLSIIKSPISPTKLASSSCTEVLFMLSSSSPTYMGMTLGDVSSQAATVSEHITTFFAWVTSTHHNILLTVLLLRWLYMVMGTNPTIIAYPGERLPGLIWSDNGDSTTSHHAYSYIALPCVSFDEMQLKNNVLCKSFQHCSQTEALCEASWVCQVLFLFSKVFSHSHIVCAVLGFIFNKAYNHTMCSEVYSLCV